MRYIVFAFCLFVLIVSQSAMAQIESRSGHSFDTWMQEFKVRAAKEGISQSLIDQAFVGVAPIERVIELDRKQPEGKWTFAQYKEKIVHPLRIRRGKEMMDKHRTKLDDIHKKYGVAPQYVVALWGIETNYGSNTGGFNIVPALATLAWEGRRAEFFSKELIHALKIVDQGHIALPDLKGSWAGALGQNQFMPSSFHAYAVDGDGDGKKDIWSDLDDVFASTATYLSRSGWQDGERWGRRVMVPAGFDVDLVDLKMRKTLAEWKKLGLKTMAGQPIPVIDGMEASLVAPDGLAGETYLAYNNYRTIMKWNRSTYFATSVGLIADAIASGS